MAPTNKKKRELLLSYLREHLAASIFVMKYLKENAKGKKAKNQCEKSIKSSLDALSYIEKIKHLDILEYLYGVFCGNNVILYSISGSIATSEKIKEWDTKEHHQEFVEFIEDTKKQYEEKQKARQENLQAIQKAKEQGKKVEMVWDNKEKKAKPLIVEQDTQS